MDKKYNTGDDGAVELKKALSKTKPRKHPKMSEAELRLKYQQKND